ncbi:GNAT family N-acetyltransferase [Desertivirga brevis]|uniref:GNAT family N-acetyltransferase n=1 Tax=Desertivirga brevis TaxID=2810310 RepID=UPI001A964265|nr:GNAT family N-acetyltransferase [Pedobacter sp. SYSU D00873]
MFKVRAAESKDFQAIFNLYKKVAATVGGISHLEEEISEAYIKNFMLKAQYNGIQLVVYGDSDPEDVLAEIHCYKPSQSVFAHVLTDLTIVVAPEVQGKGAGKLLFRSLQQEIKTNRKDILRVELIVRETNFRAISFYRSIDFRIEGRFERRIDSRNGRFESDIPMAWFNSEFENPYLKRKED